LDAKLFFGTRLDIGTIFSQSDTSNCNVRLGDSVVILDSWSGVSFGIVPEESSSYTKSSSLGSSGVWIACAITAIVVLLAVPGYLFNV